jgi:periplasmic protein TonB
MDAGNRFSRCLLDQKDEESRRARRLRRRTLLIAIFIQAFLLTLLCLRPLFGAQELHLTARLVPLPPWKGQPGAHASTPHHEVRHNGQFRDIQPRPIFYNPSNRPAEHVRTDDAPDVGPISNLPPGGGFGDPNGLIPLGGQPGPIRPSLPAPPHEVEAPRHGPRPVPSEIQQALLVVRVEPQYPALARQIRLEGTVQIRAVIAADGTVQSAEVLSGHPLLARAARDAILQWRYRPTLLGGRPIEVETLITVIFKMH